MTKQFFFFFLLLFTSSCAKVLHIADVTVQTPKIEASVEADEATKALIAPYKQKINAEMNRVIGECAKTLTKAKPVSTLGNWMCDALHHQSEIYTKQKIDFSAVNYGGIRLPTLPKGKITKGKIFELMPFDNMIVILEMKGQVVQQLFDHIAAKGGWPISQQVQFTIQDNRAKNISINGQALDFNQTYRMAISDYIANGGDQCTFLKTLKRVTVGKLIRDALIEFAEAQYSRNKMINAELDQRIILSN